MRLTWTLWWLTLIAWLATGFALVAAIANDDAPSAALCGAGAMAGAFVLLVTPGRPQ